jgi:creatinine amidohydrolase
MTTRKLAELSGPATLDRLSADSVIILPIGAIEHHGPHLPLVTDSLIAESVASAAVERGVAAGLDLWQLPTLSFTKSDEHHWASGTMWINWDTLMSTLIDIGRSVANTPARRLVFVNGHGGNAALLGVANRELRRRFGLSTFSMAAGSVTAATGEGGEPDEHGMGIHAGFGETSLVMHLRPDLVTPELAERNLPEHMAALQYIGFNGYPVSFGWTSDDFGLSGVIGDPTGASAARGAELFERAVDNVVGALGEIAVFTPRASGE